MKDTKVASLQVGGYFVVRWPEIRRWLTDDGDQEMPCTFLDTLAAADLFCFSSGPHEDLWWAVSMPAQKDQLQRIGIDPGRVMLRSQMEGVLTALQHDPEELRALPLLSLLKLILSEPPSRSAPGLN